MGEAAREAAWSNKAPPMKDFVESIAAAVRPKKRTASA
jgi:hypothetical protein